jgi:tripartite-type tricarboxylate transporter receptor subunit TctC
MVHIPYRGTGPALTGIMGGEVPIMFMTATAAVPLIRDKRLRGVAVTSTTRLPATPTLPTIAEAGLRDYQSAQWYGLLAPTGTPAEALNLFNTLGAKFVQSPDINQRLINDGAIPVGGTRQQFAAHIKSEFVKWADVIRKSGARAD